MDEIQPGRVVIPRHLRHRHDAAGARPDRAHATGSDPDVSRRLLADDWPRFLNLAKGFLLLSVFRVIHHKDFHAIKRIDENFVRINFLALMFIAPLVLALTFVDPSWSSLACLSIPFISLTRTAAVDHRRGLIFARRRRWRSGLPR